MEELGRHASVRSSFSGIGALKVDNQRSHKQVNNNDKMNKKKIM